MKKHILLRQIDQGKKTHFLVKYFHLYMHLYAFYGFVCLFVCLLAYNKQELTLSCHCWVITNCLGVKMLSTKIQQKDQLSVKEVLVRMNI